MVFLVVLVLLLVAFGAYVYIKNTPTTIGGELTDAETLVDTEVLAPVKAEASVVVADVKKVV